MGPHNDRCHCGQYKYPDADQCEMCYTRGRAYDERNYGNQNICSCGNSKYPDANQCEECYRRNSVYGP